MLRILIADDEIIALQIIKSELSGAGYQVMAAGDGKEAGDLIEKHDFDMVLLDVRMPHKSGFELIEQVRRKSPQCLIIIMTAYASIDNAIRAIKLGADDYIAKPFDIEELLAKIRRIHTEKPESLAGGELRQDSGLFGEDPQMRQIKHMIGKTKDLNTTILLTGESGTGKGVIAREIHNTSQKRDLPFIHVDCAVLPQNLIESELFGFEKGAFTGANAMKKGKFEAAGKGTVFLDEIGTLPLNLQAKLLTVLQDKYFYRISGNIKIPVEARIISATNKNLEDAVRNGTFREDLYYRLNVIHIEVPPLRMRKGDIRPLTGLFLKRFIHSMGKPITAVEDEFFNRLEAYDWPGNIRELEHAVERAVALCDGSCLKADNLPARVYAVDPAALSLELQMRQSIEQQEMLSIIAALERCRGHREKTAQALGISRRNLQYKLKKYNLLE